jgi:hypothetical protein
MSDASGAPGNGTEKEGGLGTEGTIPSGPAGVGVGAGEPSHFEPEEDPEAAPQPPNAQPDEEPDEDAIEGSGHA